MRDILKEIPRGNIDDPLCLFRYISSEPNLHILATFFVAEADYACEQGSKQYRNIDYHDYSFEIDLNFDKSKINDPNQAQEQEWEKYELKQSLSTLLKFEKNSFIQLLPKLFYKSPSESADLINYILLDFQKQIQNIEDSDTHKQFPEIREIIESIKTYIEHEYNEYIPEKNKVTHIKTIKSFESVQEPNEKSIDKKHFRELYNLLQNADPYFDNSESEFIDFFYSISRKNYSTKKLVDIRFKNAKAIYYFISILNRNKSLDYLILESKKILQIKGQFFLKDRTDSYPYNAPSKYRKIIDDWYSRI